MIRLSAEIIKQLHAMIIQTTGGSSGLRDENLLKSASDGIFQTFGGEELYPSLEMKGARLGYSLITGHSFLDGNKRIGILAMLTFLEVNGLHIRCTDDDIVKLGLRTASDEISCEELFDWIVCQEMSYMG